MGTKGEGHSLTVVQGHSDIKIRTLKKKKNKKKKTAGQIETKFHMKSLWHEGTKNYSNGPGYMTKVAANAIYGQNPSKIFFSETKWAMTLKLGMQHWGLRSCQVCSNDDPWLTFTCFTSRSSSVI